MSTTVLRIRYSNWPKNLLTVKTVENLPFRRSGWLQNAAQSERSSNPINNIKFIWWHKYNFKKIRQTGHPGRKPCSDRCP